MLRDGILPYLQLIKHLKPNSLRLVSSRLDIIERWLEGRALSQDLLEEFLNDLILKGRSEGAINSYLFAVKMYMDFHEYKNFPHNLKIIPMFKKKKKVINVLTPDEVIRICQAKPPRRTYQGKDLTEYDFVNESFVYFLALTGCRMTEARLLKVKNVNLEKGECWFTETKNDDPRKAIVTGIVVEHLRTLCAGKGPEAYVFTNMEGKPLIEQLLRYDIKRRAIIAGVTKRVHPHLFRHSLATTLLENGVDISIVARILGHRDVNTTYSTYMHLSDDSIRKAIIRHPVVRDQTDPEVILTHIKETIRSLGVQDDHRFIFKFTESANSFELLVARR